MNHKLSLNKSGNVKIGKRKCRIFKKGELIPIASNAGIQDAKKKTKKQLCAELSSKVNKNNIPLAKLFPVNKNNIPLAKLFPVNKNNIPLAKLFPIKSTVKKNNVPHAKVIPGSISAMPNISTIIKSKPAPSKMTMTKNIAAKRIDAIKMLSKSNKTKLKQMLNTKIAPSKVVTLGREMARLK